MHCKALRAVSDSSFQLKILHRENQRSLYIWFVSSTMQGCQFSKFCAEVDFEEFIKFNTSTQCLQGAEKQPQWFYNEFLFCSVMWEVFLLIVLKTRSENWWPSLSKALLKAHSVAHSDLILHGLRFLQDLRVHLCLLGWYVNTLVCM